LVSGFKLFLDDIDIIFIKLSIRNTSSRHLPEVDKPLTLIAQQRRE
jgi:hypothetical protein